MFRKGNRKQKKLFVCIWTQMFGDAVMNSEKGRRIIRWTFEIIPTTEDLHLYLLTKW